MVNISVATVNDIDIIQKIRKETWLDTYPNPELGITIEDVESEFVETPDQKIKNRKRREKWIIEPSIYNLIAREENRAIGFFIGRKFPKYSRIGAIYILPDFQGKGIGAMLMKKGLGWLGDDLDILVNLASYNKNAQEFYRKFGFELTGKNATDTHHPLASGKVIPEVEMKKPAR